MKNLQESVALNRIDGYSLDNTLRKRRIPGNPTEYDVYHIEIIVNGKRDTYYIFPSEKEALAGASDNDDKESSRTKKYLESFASPNRKI